MCGGTFSIAARSAAVVSPVLTAAVILGESRPVLVAISRIPCRGSARFL
jgi:hypothetical protein